jgi:hypothetical protein
MKDEERERLQRLRDAQIAARDPGPSKIPGYDWQQHIRRGQQIKAKRQSERKPLLVELFLILPGRWRGAVYGVLVGLIPAIPARLFLSDEMALLAVVPLIICGIVGYVLGAVMEPDKEDRA